jgi:regulatory protein
VKITAIKQQIKNPERASVFLDGKYAFSLTLNELVAERLKIGQGLDEAEHKRLKKISEDGKLTARALEWVLNRPRSNREFRDYMFRKKAEPEMIQRTLDEFTDRGYLDEARYVAWMIDLRRRKGKSERAIRAELASKGVDREVVTQAAERGGDEQERLRALVTKKSRLPRYKADPQKLLQYLARQGYDYDDIKRVLAELS